MDETGLGIIDLATLEYIEEAGLGVRDQAALEYIDVQVCVCVCVCVCVYVCVYVCICSKQTSVCILHRMSEENEKNCELLIQHKANCHPLEGPPPQG